MSELNQASITTWNRLEPYSRDPTLSDGLQTKVHDPLWFLARQWQLGEFTGDDAGSPIQCSWRVDSVPITGYRPGPSGSAVLPIDSSMPLETHVEREKVSLGLKGSVQLGLNFEQSLNGSNISSGTLSTIIKPWFRKTYSISKDPAAGEVADAAGLAYRATVAGRITDGMAVLADSNLTSQTFLQQNITGLSNNDANAIIGVVKDFQNYWNSLYEEPSSNDKTWNYQDLRYSFALGVQSSLGQIELDGSGFTGGALDWFSFDLIPSPVDTFLNAPVTSKYYASVPTHVTFRGMPNARWWMFDDRSSDLGQLIADQTDLVKLLIMEFANVYGNDWFQLPVPLAVGTLSKISILIVTDTFGFTTQIEPANSNDSSSNPWGMFVLSGADGRNDLLFLPSTLSSVEKSDPIEKVDFIKDDMAAMVWGVERTLQGPLDRGVDGYESYLLNLKASPRPPLPSPSPGTDIAYILNTTVPYNWIPFVPQQQLNPNSMILRRGSMLQYDPKTDTTTWITPQGVILQPTGPAATQTSSGPPKFNPMILNPQAVPRIGTNVLRMFRRSISIDGSTHVWISRRIDVGHGPGSSGLVFDEIVPIPGVPTVSSTGD